MAHAEESSTVLAQETDETSRIECHVDLKAFFHETLSHALSQRKVEVPEPTEFYLVGLLATLRDVSRSLVELSFAQEGDDCSRLTRLRSVGDQALSVSGLFDAQLERRGISRSYLSDLGSRAYRGASVLARKSRDARAEVFEDLGSHFTTYAELLEDVREATALGTPDDVLALYERFQKTRSPALAERLLGHGVLPIRGSSAAS